MKQGTGSPAIPISEWTPANAGPFARAYSRGDSFAIVDAPSAGHDPFLPLSLASHTEAMRDSGR